MDEEDPAVQAMRTVPNAFCVNIIMTPTLIVVMMVSSATHDTARFYITTSMVPYHTVREVVPYHQGLPYVSTK